MNVSSLHFSGTSVINGVNIYHSVCFLWSFCAIYLIVWMPHSLSIATKKAYSLLI